jgi:hypothetical protein
MNIGSFCNPEHPLHALFSIRSMSPKILFSMQQEFLMIDEANHCRRIDYRRLLMWNFIVTTDGTIEANNIKFPKVGFFKLLKDNTETTSCVVSFHSSDVF